MKLRALPYLSLCVFFLIACDAPASRAPADVVTFDSAKRLDDFDFSASGAARPGEWLVIDNDAGRGLAAQIDAEPAENRLPFGIYRHLSAHDVHVSTRFMAISGKIDQAAGVIVRFRSPDDYYAVRASALENNVKLYRVVAGRREMIGSMEINVSGQAWHTLVSRRETTASRYFSTAGSFLSQAAGGFPVPPARLVCGPRPTA